MSPSESPDRPLRADARRNHERIVAAAREVLRESGAEASLDEMARRAGVGIGTLYRRFPTRLALLEAVYREDVDVLGQRARAFVEELEPWPAVEAFAEVFLDYAVTKRALFTELVDAVGRDGELLTHSRQVLRESSELVLTRAQDAGVVRADVDPTDLPRLLGGCTMMGDIEPDQRRRLLSVVLAGLRATPDATPGSR